MNLVASEAGVKAYINSDFGSDYDPDTYGSAIWTPKKANREAAEKLGIKTVGISNGAFFNYMRTPFIFGK